MMSHRLALIRLRARLGPERALSYAGLFVAILIGLFLVLPMKSSWPNDYYGFWLAGQSSRAAGITNIYSYHGQLGMAANAAAEADFAPSALERRMRRFYKMVDLTGTPMLYTTIRLLSTGNLKRDVRLFQGLSAVVYITGLLVFAAYLGFPGWSLPLIVSFFTLAYWPFHRDVMDANCSAFLAGLVMLALTLFRSRAPAWRFLAGLALGCICLFKPTPMYAVLFAAFAFWLTDRRSLAWFAAGVAASGAVGLVLPYVVLGPSCTWPAWFDHIQGRSFAMRHMAGGVLGRYFRVSSPIWFQAAAVAAVALCGAAMWRCLRRSLPRPGGLDAVSVAAAGLNAYLLTGVLVWGHYFTLAAPSALLAIRPMPHRPNGGRNVRIAGVVGCLGVGLHAQFRQWGWTTWGNYSPFTLSATLLLLVLVLWDLRPANVEPA